MIFTGVGFYIGAKECYTTISYFSFLSKKFKIFGILNYSSETQSILLRQANWKANFRKTYSTIKSKTKFRKTPQINFLPILKILYSDFQYRLSEQSYK